MDVEVVYPMMLIAERVTKALTPATASALPIPAPPPASSSTTTRRGTTARSCSRRMPREALPWLRGSQWIENEDEENEDEEEARRVPGAHGVLVFQQLQHEGAGGERQTAPHGRSGGEWKAAGEGGRSSGSGGEKELAGSQSEHVLPHGLEPVEGELQPHLEQEEHDAELAQHVDHVQVSYPVQSERTLRDKGR